MKHVEKYAQLLDTLVPGWAKRINLETLDLELCTKCVLGQVAGDYSIGRRLFLPDSEPVFLDWPFTSNADLPAWKLEVLKRVGVPNA